MLERVEDPSQSLKNEPKFIKTWAQLPEQSSVKVYISKRAVAGIQHFYTLTIKKQWTTNLQFLKKQHLSSGAMMQLNFSKSGLAFAISSDENITLKSPLSKPLITMDSKTIT